MEYDKLRSRSGGHWQRAMRQQSDPPVLHAVRYKLWWNDGHLLLGQHTICKRGHWGRSGYSYVRSEQHLSPNSHSPPVEVFLSWLWREQYHPGWRSNAALDGQACSHCHRYRGLRSRSSMNFRNDLMQICFLVNLFQVSGLVGCCPSSAVMLGRFALSSSCLRLTIRPLAEGSSALARSNFLARALSSRLALELIKFNLCCMILDSISSDPRRMLREEFGQRVGRPWIVRTQYFSVNMCSIIFSSVFVNVQSSAPYKRMGMHREL